MKTKRFLSFAAIFAISLTFFACSSESPSSGGQQGGEPSSNSSEMVFCKLNSGACSQMSLSTCMELVKAGEAQIVSNCNAETPPSSSSALPPSSSSIAPLPSSSSVAPQTPSSSSSSVVQGCTPADNNNTHYCSNGFLREYGRVSFGTTTYKTVVIGTQTWMAENLSGGVGGWGYFEYPLTLDYSSVCPSSWHLPNSDEWDILTNFVKTDSKCGFNCAGKKLKARSGWNNNGNGTDDYGFSALPKGYLNGISYEFEFDKGDVAVWWVNSCSEALMFCDYRAIISDSDDISHFVLSPSLVASPDNVVLDGWYSVRCIKD